MTTPKVNVKKQSGNTGVTKPAPDGILAIIAPGAGVVNQPASYAAAKSALAGQGYTPLTDIACYVMAKTGKRVVCLPPTCSSAATYSAFTFVGTGTSVPSGHGGAAPLDDYRVLVKVVLGGTLGAGPITFTYSLDNGVSTSANISLGVALFYVIPNTGIRIDFAAGTLVTGDSFTFTTTGARASDADLATAYEALRTSSYVYEGILVFGTFDATAVAAIDTWIAARETEGLFPHFYANTRHMTAGESEATFLAAMNTAYNAASSERGLVAADCVTIPSSIPGWGVQMVRDSAIVTAARCMSIDISRDPAFVDDGPVDGTLYSDITGNQIHHDELNAPGLDDIRLTALRTFNGQTGTYINNPTMISPIGSDFVFIQHVRVMNRACSLAYQVLTKQLSLGVGALPNTDIGNGEYIVESDALRIDTLVDQQLEGQLVKPKRCTGAKFLTSRSDDLSSNAGAIVTGDVQVSALRYIKGFNVNAFFVKQITAQAA